MSDFLGQLQSANDYLNNTKLNVPTEVDITPDGAVVKNETSYSMRELICSLLAGNGLKLPNIQICLKVNVGRLLSELGANPNAALADMYAALEEAEAALDEFIEHTKIEEVLGRLNTAVAEFAAIANMINFCGTPVNPRPIPNVLADMAGSFTGEGKRLLDNLGEMLDSDIGGCLGTGGGGLGNFGFQPIFAGGVLADIQNNLSNLANLPQSTLDGFASQLRAFSNDIKNLIEFENNFGGGSTQSGGQGGSNFAPTDRVNTNVGVGIDPANMTLQEAQSLAAQLQSAFDQLSAYSVDENGNSIFDYILEPELLARMRNQTDPEIQTITRQPTYDYCGRVTGYTDVQNDAASATSSGSTRELSTQPGITNTNTAPSEGISVSQLKQIANNSSSFQDFVNQINNLPD